MPDAFYAMSWTDYSRSAAGYWLRNCRRLEAVRKGAYFTVIMNADPKKVKSIKETDLFWVYTDGPKPVIKEIVISVNEWDAIKRRYNKK